MRRKLLVLGSMCALMMVAVVVVVAPDAAVGDPPPRGDTVVYVTGQGLYYDSVVNGPLPPEGPFQLLVETTDGLQTEFGPGDPGYRGGRWKKSDGMGGYVYFSCPLLPPGRENP